MSNKFDRMTTDEKQLWVKNRREELEKRLGELDEQKRMEEEKFKQEMYQLRVVRKKSQGLGDTVEKTIKKITGGKVKTCGGCRKRRDALNKMFPYKQKNE